MRTLKKALCIVLALVMAVGLLTVAAGAKSLGDYSDADKVSDEYAIAVDVNTQLGVLKGMTDATYEPQGTLNRAQLATIIYRIVTGDVKDKYVANYANAQRFSDVPSDAWFAGYVNYCADNGYLKGVGGGNYDPAGTLTGYQAMAALLRAIGYDKNHEYEGTDWTVAVTKDAKAINAGIKADWANPVSREIAAQLAFNALNADGVTYIAFLGDYIKGADPLLESVFGVADQGIAYGAGGDPSYQYTDARGNVLVDMPLEPVATYTTKVLPCDILVDAGIPKTDNSMYRAEFWENGVCVDKYVPITHADKDCEDWMLDGQGVLTRVYDVSAYRHVTDLLIAQTYYYLAKVTKVTNDAHGTPGGIELEVYAGRDGYTVKGLANAEGYKKGDYVIVHPLFKANDEWYAPVLSAAADGPKARVQVETWNVVIDQLAETFTGKLEKIVDDSRLQTVVFTIDGKEYDLDIDYFYSVVHANKVFVGSEFTWFFDLFGNLIGDKAPAAPATQYVVVDRISWVTVPNKDGYALTDIVKMDATKETINTTKINGDTTENGDPYGIDYNANSGRVSQDWKQNRDWENELYVIKGTTLEEAGIHGRHATIKNGISTIGYTVGYGFFTQQHEIYGNADTVYLYRTGNRNTGYTYTSYVGVNNAPSVTNVDIWYIHNEDRYAEVVFVDVNTDQPQFTSDTYIVPEYLYPVARIYNEDDPDVDLYIYVLYTLAGEEVEIVTDDRDIEMLAPGLWVLKFDEDEVYTGNADAIVAPGYTSTPVAADDTYEGGVYLDVSAPLGHNQFNFTNATIYVIDDDVTTVDPADAGKYLSGPAAAGNELLVLTKEYNAQSYSVAYIIHAVR